jgi:hypothetical protein
VTPLRNSRPLPTPGLRVRLARLVIRSIPFGIGLLAFAAPVAATAADWNVLVGYGIVGAAQYDQGLYKPMLTGNITGFLRAGDHVSFLGAGLAIRATHGLDVPFKTHEFDEYGLAVPFATFRKRRAVAQVGVEIQRYNLRKTLYYLAFGFGSGFTGSTASRESRAPDGPPQGYASAGAVPRSGTGDHHTPQ